MDFKDEFDFISEKAKQLTDTGIAQAQMHKNRRTDKGKIHRAWQNYVRYG